MVNMGRLEAVEEFFRLWEIFFESQNGYQSHCYAPVDSPLWRIHISVIEEIMATPRGEIIFKVQTLAEVLVPIAERSDGMLLGSLEQSLKYLAQNQPVFCQVFVNLCLEIIDREKTRALTAGHNDRPDHQQTTHAPDAGAVHQAAS